jgi:hypothetical protein
LTVKPFIDPEGWVRILTKENQQIRLDYKGEITAEMIASNFKFKDFGVSNSEETMNT